jgi:hypothetical protein
MSTEIARQAAPPAPASEATAIIQVIERAAMNPDVDIDKMERLLQMQERVLDRQAASDYSAAMAGMQMEIPSIAERGKTNNGRYATLEDIVDTVRPILQKHGFAVSFRVKTQQGAVEVTGVLMHRGGHREETTMMLPTDTSGNKNAVQAFGSSVSYGKRYVLCSLLNITTRGEDDDGNSAAPTKTVTAFQAGQIAQTVERCPEATREWFAQHYGDASKVPKVQFDKLMAGLRKAMAKAQEGEHADADA